MSNTLIRRAFETRVKTWASAQVPPIPVAYENVPFVPPAAGGRYVRAFVLTGSTDSRDLEGKHREYVGVFQVSVVLPLGGGSKGALDLAESLDTVFSAGPPLVQDGFNVWVTSPMSPSPPLIEPDRYVVPISCNYKAEAFVS